MRLRVIMASVTGLVLAVSACQRGPVPASQAAAGNNSSFALPGGAENWPRDEACRRLADEKLNVAAAVRLVRLAGLTPLCVPAELGAEQFKRLRLVRLGEERFALGLMDRHAGHGLRAAVLIAASGAVTPLAEGVEEELIGLHVSSDAEVFPHLATLPHRVLLIGDEITTALALGPDAPVRFELRRQGSRPYIALVLTENDKEVTRFRWDPYEGAFLGPAADKLPEPPGGRFQLDLGASRHLVPQGGEVPEPEENIEMPPPRERPVPAKPPVLPV